MPLPLSRKPLDILIVEDNPADVRMAQEALKLAGFAHRLHVVTDGEQALAFLKQVGEFGDAPPPDLVLLDLKLPKLNGVAVLSEIRSRPRLQRAAVVVLTGSSLKEDEARCRELAADLFFTKPVGVEEYVAAMKRFRDLALSA